MGELKHKHLIVSMSIVAVHVELLIQLVQKFAAGHAQRNVDAPSTLERCNWHAHLDIAFVITYILDDYVYRLQALVLQLTTLCKTPLWARYMVQQSICNFPSNTLSQ